MTTQTLATFLDQLEQSAHAASVEEENYRREVATHIQTLERARAFGFRRLNLMRVMVAAIQPCDTEEEAIAQGSTAFLREVGWSSESESQQEALEKFRPVICACWQAKQAEGEESGEDIGHKLSDFERWFGEARNGPFLTVLEREIVELPLVEVC